jgi:hypothetical protein
MPTIALLLTLIAAPARAGEPEPDAMDREDIELDRRIEVKDEVALPPSVDARVDVARHALAVGDNDMARTLLLSAATETPARADVQADLGIAWMGTYYAHFGLTEATWTRLQGVAVDPAGALAGPPLRPDEITAALARGFAVPAVRPTSTARGGSVAPTPLTRGAHGRPPPPLPAPKHPPPLH